MAVAVAVAPHSPVALPRLVGHLILCGLWALCGVALALAGAPAVATAQEGSGGPLLRVRSLRVAPSVVGSGGVASVEAVLENQGELPAHAVRLGVAVAYGPDKAWALVDRTPADPIPIIMPGEAVRFQARIRLDGSGVYEVGVAGQTASGPLPPVSQRVRAIDPARFLGEAVPLFAAYAVGVGAAALVVWAAVSGRARSPAFVPHRAGLAVAGILLTAGVLLPLLARGSVPFAGGSAATPNPSVGLLVVCAVLIGAGWLGLGAALRPRGSSRRGAVAALVLYYIVGLAYTIAANANAGGRTDALLGNMLRSPVVFAVPLLWPWHALTISIAGIAANQ